MLLKKLIIEAFGTGLLLMAIVGSGIMGQKLSGGNAALALLANTLSTGMILGVLILIFRPFSGAHFNPAVTLADAISGGFAWRHVFPYCTAQIIGAVLGVALAHLMFELPVFSYSTTTRTGQGQMISEFIATFGLLAVIWGCACNQSSATPYAVAAYISSAYWFTASTSFANPAVTVARSFTDSFSGIHLHDTPAFIAAQLAGAMCATLFFRYLTFSPSKS